MCKKHHEDTESFKERFAEDIQKLSEAFAVNPFSSDTFTAVNITNIVFTDEISNTIKIIDELGENQFLKFWNERLVKGEIPITETVTNNKLPLPKDLGNEKNAVIKDPILNAKMISHLQSAYEYRTSLVKTLLSNELFGIAQSISQNSLQLYPGTKSGILNRLKTRHL